MPSIPAKIRQGTPNPASRRISQTLNPEFCLPDSLLLDFALRALGFTSCNLRSALESQQAEKEFQWSRAIEERSNSILHSYPHWMQFGRRVCKLRNRHKGQLCKCRRIIKNNTKYRCK